VSETVVSVVPRPRSAEVRRLPAAERELIEGIERSLEILQGKWKVQLVFLMARGVHRHCRLLDCLAGASKKMMTDTLRALERDGLVKRRVFAEVPLRVEYSLTPLGWSITEPLIALADWHREHEPDVRDAHSRHREHVSARVGATAPARMAEAAR
jgi:DNA-binding HxlR family transcriptional regulator